MGYEDLELEVELLKEKIENVLKMKNLEYKGTWFFGYNCCLNNVKKVLEK